MGMTTSTSASLPHRRVDPDVSSSLILGLGGLLARLYAVPVVGRTESSLQNEDDEIKGKDNKKYKSFKK